MTTQTQTEKTEEPKLLTASELADKAGCYLQILRRSAVALLTETGVAPPFGWRAWPALIDAVSECCRAQRRLLTARCQWHIIARKKMRVGMPHCELK